MLRAAGHWLLGSLILLTACSSAPGTVNSSPDIRGLAMVEEVDILTLTSEPPQIVVEVRGFVGDPCTQLQEPIIIPSPATRSFTVTLETLRPADVICIQMLASFEISFRLPMAGLPRGEYLVSVNGVSEPFFF